MRAHLVRYEDVHSPEPRQPDWLQELLEEGAVQVQQPAPGVPGGMLLAPSNNLPYGEFAGMGDWILCRPDDTLYVVSADRLTSDYDLVG